MGETIVYGLKVAAAVAGGVVAIALFNSLFSIITLPQFTNEFDEVIKLVSIYLPFRPSLLLDFITTILTGIIGFLVGYIIWVLLSEVRKET